MLSPAKASYQRKLAALAAGAPVAGAAAPMPTEGPVATEHQMLLASLGQDLNRLRNIEATDNKIAAKREMIGTYLPWVLGAVDAGAGVQDEIVSTMMIWAIDVADWPLALRIAAYVLAAGIALPERYKRSPAALVAEEVAEAGLLDTPTVDLETLRSVAALIDGKDMHDQVRAKLEKALGLGFKARADAFDPEADSAVGGGKGALIDAALGHLREALRLNSASGVKKLIERLETERRKLTAPTNEGNTHGQ